MATNNRRTGALRERLHFQMRVPGDDGWGNPLPGAGEFETQFTVSAALLPLRGSEAVQAARLQGRQPYIVTVRQSSDTRKVTTAWQLVDARNPDRKFAVTAPATDPDMKNAWFEILVVEGAVS